VAAGVFLTLMLSGCATPVQLTARHRQALDYYVGLDEADLIAALGPPTQRATVNQEPTLVYAFHAAKWVPAQPWREDTIGRPIGPWVEDESCTTRFRLERGKVAAWSVAGNDCADSDNPKLNEAVAVVLDRWRGDFVNDEASFQHDKFTGRSIVDAGAWQSN
jgi:hypothetical protein